MVLARLNYEDEGGFRDLPLELLFSSIFYLLLL
jgi:hypothetical protein